jgi:hypothetical protein
MRERERDDGDDDDGCLYCVLLYDCSLLTGPVTVVMVMMMMMMGLMGERATHTSASPSTNYKILAGNLRASTRHTALTTDVPILHLFYVGNPCTYVLFV